MVDAIGHAVKAASGDPTRGSAYVPVVRRRLPRKTKGGPPARPASVQPVTYLDAVANHAEFGIQLAAEEQQRSYGKNRDQRKDECVFRETLTFLAAKEEEQERPPFTSSARRLRTLAD